MSEEEKNEEKTINPPEVLKNWIRQNTPSGLFLRLRQKVLGQDEELRKAAILVYGHIQSVAEGLTDTKVHFMVEGRSGCGKTTFARALADILPCPVITMDASQLTPSGYKGAEAGDFISSKELRDWWGCGVVILDELDKLMEPVSSSDGNFHRQSVENLLKMLDGGEIVGRDGDTMDSSRILFIGMGAFTPLKKERPEEQEKPKPVRTVGPIGFAAPAREAPPTPESEEEAEKEKKEQELSKELMTRFCGSEQFLGRFVTVFHFKPLGRPLYRQIVEQTEREISRIYGDFSLPEEAAERIVDRAMSSEFGCRSIKAEVWEAFLGTESVIPKDTDQAIEKALNFRRRGRRMTPEQAAAYRAQIGR